MERRARHLGGVAGGVLGGWLAARRMHVPLPPLLDVVAPALPLGAGHRPLGQLLQPGAFRPALQAAVGGAHHQPGPAGEHLPAQYRPPFVDGVTCRGPSSPRSCTSASGTWPRGPRAADRAQGQAAAGYLFAAYAAIYTFGRFFTEYLRIDPSHRYLGLRLNDWTSIGVFVCAGAILLLKGRPKPGDDLVGEPLPAAVRAAEKARAEQAARRGQPPAAEEEAEEEEEAGEPAPGGAEPNQDKPSQEKPSQDKQAAAAGGTGGGQTDAVGGEAAAAAVAVATKDEKGAEERTTEDGGGWAGARERRAWLRRAR